MPKLVILKCEAMHTSNFFCSQNEYVIPVTYCLTRSVTDPLV